MPIETSGKGIDSDMDGTLAPNPLVSKLISIDEKEVKDLKNKDKAEPSNTNNSKKRIKAAGGKKGGKSASL